MYRNTVRYSVRTEMLNSLGRTVRQLIVKVVPGAEVSCCSSGYLAFSFAIAFILIIDCIDLKF